MTKVICNNCKVPTDLAIDKRNCTNCRAYLQVTGYIPCGKVEDDSHFLSPNKNSSTSAPQYLEFDGDTSDFVTEQITNLLRDKGSFTSDDLDIGNKNRLVLGAIINSLARRGIIKSDGHIKSKRKECHAREICRWVKK